MNNKLKKLRLECGLTQSQMAVKISTCERNYRRIENENTDPRTSVSIAIAKVLNTTVEELFDSPKRQLKRANKNVKQNNNIIKKGK